MTRNLNNNIVHDNEESSISTKIIFKSYIARALLKLGHTIVDIKPYRDDPARTVFVFKDSLKLRNDMSAIIKERDEKSKDKANKKIGAGDEKNLANDLVYRPSKHDVVEEG